MGWSWVHTLNCDTPPGSPPEDIVLGPGQPGGKGLHLSSWVCVCDTHITTTKPHKQVTREVGRGSHFWVQVSSGCLKTCPCRRQQNEAAGRAPHSSQEAGEDSPGEGRPPQAGEGQDPPTPMSIPLSPPTVRAGPGALPRVSRYLLHIQKQ